MYNNNGRIGVAQVELLVNREFKWIFREQPTDDYGIDAQIEIHNGEYATGKLIAVQIKSGQSYFKEVKDGKVVFRVDKKHLLYWTKHSLPVIIVLYNPDNDNCIWEYVSNESIIKTPDGNCKILISIENKFNASAKIILQKISDNLTEYERRLNSLVLAKTWMKEIHNGNRVILESDEWINKCSGQGSFKLKIINSNTMEEKIAINWPMVFFPMQSYESVFEKVFPWAEISIDEDFYEDYDEERFKEEECPYDNETGEYIFIEEFHDEWEERQPDVRAYANSAGEVDHYRLELQLNDLGMTFLKLDEYLESERFYTISKEDIE